MGSTEITGKTTPFKDQPGMEAASKTILLIGSGYVGKGLLKFWDKEAYHLIASTTSSEKEALLQEISDEVAVVKTSEKEKLASLLERSDACIITVAPKNSSSYVETYLESAHNITYLIQGRQKPLHLIYTSSTSVYGKAETSFVNEEFPLKPETDNQRILAETEQVYMGAKSRCVTVTILRLAGIYGPGRDLFSRAARALSQPLPGTGEEKTNHTHLDDIVGAIDFCLEKGVEGIYNLVMDAHPTRGELYGELAKKLGLPAPKWDSKLQASHGIGCAVDSSKLKAKGYSFAHTRLFD